jgi:WD40 repeat protein
MISGGWDKTIKFWRLATGEKLQTWEAHRLAVTALAISPDGRTLASGSRDKTVKICDIGTGQLLHNIENRREEVSPQIASVVFSQDGKVLYTGTQGGSAYYWDVKTGKKLGSLGPISTGCSHFALSRDGRILAGAYLSKLEINELPSCTILHQIRTGLGVISSIAISPNGEIVFSGHQSGDIYLWDTRRGGRFALLKEHEDIVEALAVGPNGRVLASGSKDQRIILWDLSSKTQLCTLEGHSEDVLTLAFSPDGKTLVSGSMDSTINIWGTPEN